MMIEDEEWTVPHYIEEGLRWLEREICPKPVAAPSVSERTAEEEAAG
jgi:hypothetical protein